MMQVLNQPHVHCVHVSCKQPIRVGRLPEVPDWLLVIQWYTCGNAYHVLKGSPTFSVLVL